MMKTIGTSSTRLTVNDLHGGPVMLTPEIDALLTAASSANANSQSYRIAASGSGGFETPTEPAHQVPVQDGEALPTSPSSDSVTGKVAPAIKTYTFPSCLPNAQLEKAPTAVLTGALQRLLLESDPATGQLIPYPMVREKACAIGCELNRRGKPMPRFRPTRTIGFGKDISEDDKLLSNDRQVLDLHWLFCKGRRRKPKSKQYLSLFSGEIFDFSLAETFVITVGSSANKIDCLNLSDGDQLELAAIQSSAIRDRFKYIMRGRRTGDGKVIRHGAQEIRTLLEDSVSREPHLHKQVDTWINLWVCGELIGRRPMMLADYFNKTREGPNVDHSWIIKRLQTIDKRLRAAGYEL